MYSIVEYNPNYYLSAPFSLISIFAHSSGSKELTAIPPGFFGDGEDGSWACMPFSFCIFSMITWSVICVLRNYQFRFLVRESFNVSSNKWLPSAISLDRSIRRPVTQNVDRRLKCDRNIVFNIISTNLCVLRNIFGKISINFCIMICWLIRFTI